MDTAIYRLSNHLISVSVVIIFIKFIMLSTEQCVCICRKERFKWFYLHMYLSVHLQNECCIVIM